MQAHTFSRSERLDPAKHLENVFGMILLRVLGYFSVLPARHLRIHHIPNPANASPLTVRNAASA
jgi:hypothetical protein